MSTRLEVTVGSDEAREAAAAKVGNSAALRLLTFNTLCLPPTLNGSNPRTRFRHICSTILNTDAYDVVCFQEVFDGTVKSILRDMLAESFPYTVTSTPKPFSYIFDSGLTIASRFPIVWAEFMPFAGSTGVDAWARLGALCACLELPGKDHVLVCTTHVQGDPDSNVLWRLVSNPWEKCHAARCSHFGQVHAFMRGLIHSHSLEMRSAGGPEKLTGAIVCGDLNCDGQDHTRLEEMMHLLDDPVDVFRACNREASGLTWNGHANSLCDDNHQQRLDYVLLLRHPDDLDEAGEATKAARFSLKPRSCEVQEMPVSCIGANDPARAFSSAAEEAVLKNTHLSDHYGLESVIDLQ